MQQAAAATTKTKIYISVSVVGSIFACEKARGGSVIIPILFTPILLFDRYQNVRVKKQNNDHFPDQVRLDKSRLRKASLGKARLGKVWVPQIRIDQVYTDIHNPDQFRLVYLVGQIRSGQVRLGQARLGQLRLSQDRLYYARSGHVSYVRSSLGLNIGI